ITSFNFYYKITKVNNKKSLNKNYKKLVNIKNDLDIHKVKLKGFNNFSVFLGRFQEVSDKSIALKQKKAVRINDNCVLCNKCVKECPTRNLVNIGKSIESRGKCTFCVRCVNVCPKQAITVLIHGKVKEQYDIRNLKY
ncbi:MAG: 4Fe-4S binding protein, partial [Lachnospirales bacterium]